MSGLVSDLGSARLVNGQLLTRFDADYGAFWYYMDPKPRPCFTPGLLAEIANSQRLVDQVNRTAFEQEIDCPVPYTILASRSPGVYSMGGDLDLFRKLIAERDREGLRHYAKSCIDVIYKMSHNHHLPMTTISLVQGDALGGGFEGALCCSVIVAERRARFGLPEVLFNLFPGMGAYSFLSRRIGPARAERLLKSGTLFPAAELHEMGVVDVLAEDGDGEKSVYEFIAQHRRRSNAYHAIFKVRQRVHDVPYEELADISEIWVDTALSIGQKDIRIMERLVKAQDKMRGEAAVAGGMQERGGL